MSKEAMKLALEALEEPHPGVRTNFTDALKYRKKIKQAITALREAQAQAQAQQQNCKDGSCDCCWKAPEQEPAAWEVGVVNGVVTRRLASPASPPSQRTWVGLTEYEKSYALQDKDGMTLDYEDYADAIEAKLKEKNT